MIVAELPLDEQLRLLDLESYELLDTAPESDFDELVELAAQICDTPISLITLLDKNRQWFKAKTGLEDAETPRDIAFCAHAILQNELMIVEDAVKDERFNDNPLVTGKLNIRFYAGAPIVSPTGHKLGTLCIIDTKPRKIKEKEERALKILSNQVTKLLDLRKKNLLLRQRAQEIIDLKSKAITKVLQTQEEEKRALAMTLHEDLSQSVASSIIYLKMSQEQTENKSPLINTAIEHMKAVLVNMRNLSIAMLPTTLNGLPADEIIREYISKIAKDYKFTLHLQVDNTSSRSDFDSYIIAIRIIEDWLKVLANKEDILSVNISIYWDDEFHLVMEDDGHTLSFEKMKQEVFDSLVYHRVHSNGGSVGLSTSTIGHNLLKVSLPLVTMVV